MTADEMIAFEESIAEAFNRGEIRAPVHLTSGNEEPLIEYFDNHVGTFDWVCTTWRSHYHCLLHGVPPDELRASIMAGHSISLCFPKHRIVSSAIAGGILPIAVGIAMGIKRAGGGVCVHCFIGDMMAQSGIMRECVSYSENKFLPIRFIIEDNALSVCTDTQATWGEKYIDDVFLGHHNVSHYKYKSKYPHAGAGRRIQF